MRLAELKLPNDANLIVTVHFYDPFSFTHQGADWVTPTPPTGQTFPTTGISLRPPWQNYSWDSTVTFKADSSIDVTYNAGRAGFYLYSDSAQTGITAFKFPTNCALKLGVACKATNDRQNITNIVTTQPKVAVTINCPATVKALFIQNASSNSQPTFAITNLELVKGGNAVSLLSSEKQNLQARFDTAATWGKAYKRPIFIGELGAYSKGDSSSRVRWTAFVRNNLERRGLSWNAGSLERVLALTTEA